MILRLTIVRCMCWTEFVFVDYFLGEGIFLGEAVEWSNGGYVVIFFGVVVVVVSSRGLAVDFLV